MVPDWKLFFENILKFVQVRFQSFSKALRPIAPFLSDRTVFVRFDGFCLFERKPSNWTETIQLVGHWTTSWR